jgi:branched-chain amino acid transport system permease protein
MSTLASKLRPTSEKTLVEVVIGIALLVFLGVFPAFSTGYWLSFILTQTFLLGIAAASMIFLYAYGGMVSLAQIAFYGIAAFALGNMVTTGQVKGLHLGLDPLLSVVLAIALTTVLGMIFGAVASRSTGIYFLMITLTYAVIAFYFFGQVTQVSGFSGIGGIQSRTPGFVGNPVTQPTRLYYLCLVIALIVYFAIRYVARTPFGIVLQGVRDDPVRMGSLGYNVELHRTLAFTFAAFVAALAGVLYGWWNGTVAPDNVGLSATVNLLIVAVIGGLGRFHCHQQLRAHHFCPRARWQLQHDYRAHLPDHRDRLAGRVDGAMGSVMEPGLAPGRRGAADGAGWCRRPTNVRKGGFSAQEESSGGSVDV